MIEETGNGVDVQHDPDTNIVKITLVRSNDQRELEPQQLSDASSKFAIYPEAHEDRLSCSGTCR